MYQTVVDLTAARARLQQARRDGAADWQFEPPVERRIDAAAQLSGAYARLRIKDWPSALAGQRPESRLRTETNRLIGVLARDLAQDRCVLCLPYTAPACLVRALRESLIRVHAEAELVESPLAALLAAVDAGRAVTPNVAVVLSGQPTVAEAILVELAEETHQTGRRLCLRLRGCSRIPVESESVARTARMIERAPVAPTLVVAAHGEQYSVALAIRERYQIESPVIAESDYVLRGAALRGMWSVGGESPCGPYAHVTIQHAAPAAIGMLGTVRTREQTDCWAWRRLIAAGQPLPWRTSIGVEWGEKRPGSVWLAAADDDSSMWLDLELDQDPLLLEDALELPAIARDVPSPNLEIEFRAGDTPWRDATAVWSDASVVTSESEIS